MILLRVSNTFIKKIHTDRKEELSFHTPGLGSFLHGSTSQPTIWLRITTNSSTNTRLVGFKHIFYTVLGWKVTGISRQSEQDFGESPLPDLQGSFAFCIPSAARGKLQSLPLLIRGTNPIMRLHPLKFIFGKESLIAAFKKVFPMHLHLGIRGFNILMGGGAQMSESKASPRC